MAQTKQDIILLIKQREEVFRQEKDDNEGIRPSVAATNDYPNNEVDFAPLEESSSGLFIPLNKIVKGLYRNSSQWDQDKNAGAWSAYNAGRDVTFLMSAIDAPQLSTSNDLFGKEARETAPRKDPSSQENAGFSPYDWQEAREESNSFPSLHEMAEKAATKAMFQDSLNLETEFATQFTTSRSNAQASIESIVEVGQVELENSKELERVKVLREELKQAETALMKKQEIIHKKCQEKVDMVQQRYDQDRAEATVAYVEKRNALVDDQIQSLQDVRVCRVEGSSLCKSCSTTFVPQDRENVAQWQRCSVPDCTSCETMCLECSNIPCRRCHAPFCASHRGVHDSVCRSECQKICGYRDGEYRNEYFPGHYSEELLLECCGDQAPDLKKCNECGAMLCRDCTYSTGGFRSSTRIFCPGCSGHSYLPTERANPNTSRRCAPWSGEECERERKRHKTYRYGFNSAPYKGFAAYDERFSTSNKSYDSDSDIVWL